MDVLTSRTFDLGSTLSYHARECQWFGRDTNGEAGCIIRLWDERRRSRGTNAGRRGFEDVPWWVLDWDKIAHPVVRHDPPWCFTYCAMMTGTPVEKPGKRGVCRVCREKLKAARLLPPA